MNSYFCISQTEKKTNHKKSIHCNILKTAKIARLQRKLKNYKVVKKKPRKTNDIILQNKSNTVVKGSFL